MTIKASDLKPFQKIPTFYDDITKEIQAEKIKKYIAQKPLKIKQGSYLIGDVFGKMLDKVV